MSASAQGEPFASLAEIPLAVFLAWAAWVSRPRSLSPFRARTTAPLPATGAPPGQAKGPPGIPSDPRCSIDRIPRTAKAHPSPASGAPRRRTLLGTMLAPTTHAQL